MTREEAKEVLIIKAGYGDFVENIIDQIYDDHEALQQPKRCDGCWYGKTTINSVICGKNGTYKEADDYCNDYEPKEQ